MTDIGRSSLDRRFAGALAMDATAAPVPKGLLDVPDRWVRRSAPRRAIWALVSAGVVAAAAFGTVALVSLVNPADRADRSAPGAGGGVDWGVGIPIERLDLEPRAGHPLGARGPSVEVARGSAGGQPFSLTVENGAGPLGVCLHTDHVTLGGGSSCGALLGEEGSIEGTFELVTVGAVGHTAAATQIEAYGLVTADAAEVWVETAAGRARAVLVPLEGTGIDGRAFIAFLPRGLEPTRLVAQDASGGTIDRVVLSMPAIFPDGPEPTPGR